MWFANQQIVAQLPIHYRLYANYCRRMWRVSQNRVVGGSFLHRLLNRIGRALHWNDIARISTDDWIVHVDLSDHRLYLVFDELLSEPAEHRVLADLLSPGDAMIDVGANHGSFALLASKLVKQQGLVIAIEPNPRLVRLVRDTLNANAFSSWIVHGVVCGDTSGEVDFYVPVGESSGTASVHKKFNSGSTKRVRVPSTTLDDLLGDQEIPGQLMIKLDIEGGEMAFLRGAQRTIRNQNPVILFEINPLAASAAGHTVEQFLLQLNRFGYRWFSTVENYPNRISCQDIDPAVHQNVVAHPF